MKRNNITKCLTLLILIIFSISISGCAHKDKEVVVTPNVKKTVKQAENQVKKNIDLGNKLLDSGKYDDAKNAYNKAIELDKKDKQTYLTIKDKYLEKNRIQDASDIVQEAINNDVDVADMKELLSQFKAKIEAMKPAEENKASQNNKQKLKQNNNLGSSPKAAVVQNKKIIGYVKNIYEKNGRKYLTIDEAKFYRGDAAVKACAADGYPGESDMDGYYISNKDKTITEYEISNSCSFSTENWQLHEGQLISNSGENEAINYDKMKGLVNTHTSKGIANGWIDNRDNLYWLIIDNNVVVQMDAQYTP